MDPHPLYGASQETVTNGWASTNPPSTKFHYFNAQGKTLCNYGKKAGRLFQWHRPQHHPEAPPSACSSCELAYSRLPASQKPQS